MEEISQVRKSYYKLHSIVIVFSIHFFSFFFFFLATDHFWFEENLPRGIRRNRRKVCQSGGLEEKYSTYGWRTALIYDSVPAMATPNWGGEAEWVFILAKETGLRREYERQDMSVKSENLQRLRLSLIGISQWICVIYIYCGGLS